MELVDQLLQEPPYGLSGEERKRKSWAALAASVEHHVANSALFAKWADLFGWSSANAAERGLADMPYIPAPAFKRLDLFSVPADAIVDVRNSSSTSTGQPSVVSRDALTLTRYRQSRTAVLDSYCRPDRPFQIGVTYDPRLNPNPRLSANLVVSVIEGRSAPGCTEYVVQEDAEDFAIDCDHFLRIVEERGDDVGLVFGQTAYLYLFLIQELKRRNLKVKLKNATLLYGWGWKKFAAQAVDTPVFIDAVHEYLGIDRDRVLDMYGFAESNTLYMACSHGWRHVPAWEDVVIRNPQTLEPVPAGQEGLLQICSALPHSYPGSALLTDDIAVQADTEQCACGRHGPAFKLMRRAAAGELVRLNQVTDQLCEIAS